MRAQLGMYNFQDEREVILKASKLVDDCGSYFHSRACLVPKSNSLSTKVRAVNDAFHAFCYEI